MQQELQHWDLQQAAQPGLGRQPVAEAEEGHGEEDEEGDKELPDGGASTPAGQVPTPDGGQDLLADGVCYKLRRDGVATRQGGGREPVGYTAFTSLP